MGPTVVSNEGSLLYSPQDNGTAGFLETLSAADGSVLSTIPGLSQHPRQTRGSPSGNYIYEISVFLASSRAWISVVDLRAGKVVRYIHVSPGYPYDPAVSPDGTKLFVASHTTKVGFEAVDTKEKPDTTGVPVAVCSLSTA